MCDNPLCTLDSLRPSRSTACTFTPLFAQNRASVLIRPVLNRWNETSTQRRMPAAVCSGSDRECQQHCFKLPLGAGGHDVEPWIVEPPPGDGIADDRAVASDLQPAG